jgi:shikimate dehydrogenase
MRKFGLIGFPLGHSFSKQYFTEKFHREQIPDCSYDNYPLPDIALLNDLISANVSLCGLNVTIPYKSEVMKYLTFIDNKAIDVGAVNVLKISGSGNKKIIKGFNTDIDGFRETITPIIKGNILNALILGTGGGSKAVSYVLRKIGLKITFVSREIKTDCITYDDLTDKVLAENQLIINTTPLGMFPDTESRPDLNYNSLSDKHILYDLVYNPEQTSFLKIGKEMGCTIISGIEMLHIQAEMAWKIWNDDSI